jgi:hypothetical protein
MTSASACPSFVYSQYFEFIIKNKFEFAIVFTCCGVFLAFFGKKFFLTSIFIIGFMLTFFITMSISFTLFIKEDTEEYIQYIVAISCFLLSLGGGYLASRMKRYGLKLIGASLGSAVGIIFP